jgi:hypothetical protein
MCAPQRLTTLWASTAHYRDSFTFTFASLLGKSAVADNVGSDALRYWNCIVLRELLQLDMGSAVAVYPQNAILRACCSVSDFKVHHTINCSTRSDPAFKELSIQILSSDVAHLEVPV